MKRIFYTLTLLFALSATAFAQQDDLARGPDILVKGPIIDNINANTNSLSSLGQTIGSANGATLTSNTATSGQVVQGESAGQVEDGQSATPHSDNPSTEELQKKAIKEINAQLSFYPNPVENTLYVQLGGKYQIRLSLVNVLGQAVYQMEGEMEAAEINVQNINRGFYFLTIQMGRERIVKRIDVR